MFTRHSVANLAACTLLASVSIFAVSAQEDAKKPKHPFCETEKPPYIIGAYKGVVEEKNLKKKKKD